MSLKKLGACLLLLGGFSLSTEASAVERSATVCLRSPTVSALEPGCSPWPFLDFDLDASIKPARLASDRMTPVAGALEGAVRTSDGTQPSALREIALDVDGDVAINAAGLRACGWKALEARRIRAARRICRDSIVGRGLAHVALSMAGDPVRLPLTLFNGGIKEGRRMLFIHSFIAAPDPIPLVAAVAIRKRPHGGLQTATRIPRIGDGSGSLVDFSIEIDRTFVHDGVERGYLEARCPDGDFRVSAPRILFRNETRAPGIPSQTMLKGTLLIPCSAGPGSRAPGRA